MQVRIDTDLARIVKRESQAHRRRFKRSKSASAIVNLTLRDALMGKLIRQHIPKSP
jgi:hypothetical protein